MIFVKADSASRLWRDTVAAVLDQGRLCSPRGLATWEAVGAHLTLTRPRRRLVCLPEHRVINAAFAAAETVWILAGVDAPWIYSYNDQLRRYTDGEILRGAYGPRLRAWGRSGPDSSVGQVDQLDQARRELLDDPDTRRAVIELWNPAVDHQGYRDVPCTLGYQFLIRDGRLDMHTRMRSQDLWLGFCYDIFAATVLHELMAWWVGAELGDYHHHVTSLHLYDEHLTRARALPQAWASPEVPQMPPLALPWEDLDAVLRDVITGTCARPGWTEFTEVMRSYRIFKAGDRADARAVAVADGGPFTGGLLAWYDYLDQTTAHLAPSEPEPTASGTVAGPSALPGPARQEQGS
ncbi:thymidylate synthase [Actinomadura harenae]|uniref:thymidylate synthase n=1 Tax=Actinomadura harenae TaxID=2483351 RepID=A0A3M2L8Z8_9ACTN|nr:thymidylate synthase [Actinomadura harenae]RMI33874.1 thymidylate synthase [Actinomadura harenae]